MPEYNTILTTTAFSDPSVLGVRFAADLAAKLKAKLILAYVVEESLPALILAASSEPAAAILEGHRKRAEQSLAEFTKEHLSGTSVQADQLSRHRFTRTGRCRYQDFIVDHNRT